MLIHSRFSEKVMQSRYISEKVMQSRYITV